MEGRV